MITKATGSSRGEISQRIARPDRSVLANDPEEILELIIEGIAETLFETPDREFLAELQKEEECDPLEKAEEVRKAFLDNLTGMRSPSGRVPNDL